MSFLFDRGAAGRYSRGMENMTETEYEQVNEDQFQSQHGRCLACESLACKQRDDGQLLTVSSCECGEELGEPVYDDKGTLGYVHAHCRESLIVKQLRDDLIEGLTVLGAVPMPVAIERANGLCMQ